jgi:alpha-galactosidase
VWFEPERVMPGTWLRQHHPEWLLAPADLPADLTYQKNWRLLDLGNPDALAWAKSTFSGIIRDVGIDVYRHDFNMHPLYYWRANEAPDRQGMNEIRYITGLYDYLDTLARDHPRLILDNSASGGRRLDFEMARRCVPLLRSDYFWDPIGDQCHSYGLSFWLPLHGQGAVASDPYAFRSGMGTQMSYAFPFFYVKGPGHEYSWNELKQRITEYRSIRKMFQGDYHPLTPYSTADDVWIAWQFHRPDLGEGMVLAFRRLRNSDDTIQLKLHGLDPAGRYRVTNLDTGDAAEVTGRDLAESGLRVSLQERPGSAVIFYKLAGGSHGN